MGYAIYQVGKRWGGYGVPAICEHPDCNEEIHRGVSYACGSEPFSEHGCDRYFCDKHLNYVRFKGDGSKCRHRNNCDCDMVQLCARCEKRKNPFPYKPETQEWVEHLLGDESWEEWRKKNPDEVLKYKELLN